MKKLIGYLRLMRPANVVTAVADVLAGMAIAGYFTEIIPGWHTTINTTPYLLPAILLCISTIGLYSGGIILNDVFDAELDAKERPERPIPSGLISKKAATIFGGVFFFIGIFTAGLYSKESQYLAGAIMISCLVYDKFLKHSSIFGPLNMGLCRGLNLLLGVSIIGPAIQQWWFLAFVPIIYIASITMISRGEVHGGSKKMLYFGGLLYAVVISCILTFAYTKDNLLPTLIFVLPFAFMIFMPLLKAIKTPIGSNIGKAVKAGVIALILMNAAWASAFGVWHVAVFIVVLLPVSLLLGKAFAVT
ncbi:UbiA-like protein EboC [Pedobacter frigoris]|uniref:UbiA-like protein EboC n=1 Tax=Pedobacter frigoris TaxID=2571272 RepID=UPI00292DFAC5|nr:UbiA-like protein EboC [Pedobacter frigoris]